MSQKVMCVQDVRRGRAAQSFQMIENLKHCNYGNVGAILSMKSMLVRMQKVVSMPDSLYPRRNDTSPHCVGYFKERDRENLTEVVEPCNLLQLTMQLIKKT